MSLLVNQLGEQLAAMKKRTEKAEAQVARVRALHRPCADPDLHDGAHCCPECSDFGRGSIFRPWPCPTARALGGDA